jgi:uncharacterized protein YodC (DUF2158 family)
MDEERKVLDTKGKPLDLEDFGKEEREARAHQRPELAGPALTPEQEKHIADAIANFPFEPGEVVIQKSGGPRMCVAGQNNGLAVVFYFNKEGQSVVSQLPPVILTKAADYREPRK